MMRHASEDPENSDAESQETGEGYRDFPHQGLRTAVSHCPNEKGIDFVGGAGRSR